MSQRKLDCPSVQLHHLPHSQAPDQAPLPPHAEHVVPGHSTAAQLVHFPCQLPGLSHLVAIAPTPSKLYFCNPSPRAAAHDAASAVDHPGYSLQHPILYTGRPTLNTRCSPCNTSTQVDPHSTRVAVPATPAHRRPSMLLTLLSPQRRCCQCCLHTRLRRLPILLLQLVRMVQYGGHR